MSRLTVLESKVAQLYSWEAYDDGAIKRQGETLVALLDYLGLSWRHIDGTPAHYEIVKKDKVNLSFLSYRR